MTQRAPKTHLRGMMDEGKAARKHVPRSAHSELILPTRDPIAILANQDSSRLPSLAPVRIGRMIEAPLAFFRGAGAIMMHDLSGAPHSGEVAVICGDAHIGNFGLFATPERRQAFELNDFDEAGLGPWEWDIKRFATSVYLAAEDAGLSRRRAKQATRRAVRGYRKTLAHLLRLSVLDRFYYQGNARWLERLLDSATYTVVRDAARKARGRTSDDALERLAMTMSDGRARIVDQPPITAHTDDVTVEACRALLHDYVETTRPDVTALLNQFELVDVARRAVGVGSVGTRCYILLFTGPDGEPLFLQVKEAQRSVLETHGGAPSFFTMHPAQLDAGEGFRVVTAQRILQSSSDAFLGYFRYDGRSYYVRQFRDMKGSVDTRSLSPKQFRKFAVMCASLLARAHAQNRTAGFISGYVGKGAVFDRAIAHWARRYARIVHQDYAALAAAVASGNMTAEMGV